MAAETGEVQAYYQRILPYFEAELAERGDGGFWTWAAGTPEGCRVLELGAGTGRATEFLARSAARVVAFDLSPELAAVARRRFADSDAPRVSFFVADMRHLELRTRFDLIVAVDDPFVHLTEDEDRQSALETVAAHLAPGGRFILDAAWMTPRRRRAAGRPAGLVTERSKGRLAVREACRCDPGTRQCVTRYEYRLNGDLAATAAFRGRLWSIAELRHRARAAGLQVAHLWGDYDRRPWDRETSPRLIAEIASI
ncbi:MAG TPA: class I SAM-dependent methyltransferase [Thermoanaerobaculia bacterium]|jgi:SAM-dependent methyltransferase|nr:class I SAM-dependent methyltransferase [Thermoanaerobaculia bacterium]